MNQKITSPGWLTRGKLSMNDVLQPLQSMTELCTGLVRAASQIDCLTD